MNSTEQLNYASSKDVSVALCNKAGEIGDELNNLFKIINWMGESGEFSTDKGSTEMEATIQSFKSMCDPYIRDVIAYAAFLDKNVVGSFQEVDSSLENSYSTLSDAYAAALTE